MTLRISHRTARALGTLGRVLITLGVVTLLFVGYQLWGTGVQHARSQEALSDQFSARLAETADLRTTTTVSGPRRGFGTNRPSGSAATTTTTEPIDPEVLAALAPVLGEPVAHIRIPSIGVDETVVYGVRVPDLRKGPGVFPGNPMPGTPGNAAIAGHRTTYGQPFHDLDLIQPGDEIVVTTLRGEFTYLVDAHDDTGEELGHFIVPETGVWVLDDFGDNRITLIACHPKMSSRQRIVVTGQLVEEPVEPPPTTRPPVDDEDDEAPVLPAEDEPTGVEDWGEGLEGDRAALVPTVVWGTLFTVALLAVAALGRLWRRLPVYALGAPVLALLLWSCFVNLDRLLPSY